MKYAILYHPRTFHEQNYRYYYLPYSILSIATMLNDHIPCRLYDNNVERCHDPKELKLPNPSEWDSVWVSAMIGKQIIDGLKFSRYIKAMRPDCPVIWGGACATLLPELVAKEPSIDFVVIGQGEITASTLWKSLTNGNRHVNVQGIATFVNGKFIRTKSRPIVDLNSLPSYRKYFNTINIEHYLRQDEHINDRTINYQSSQGCPYHCGFCCEPVLWSNRWTALSGQRIVEDVKYLADNYSVNGVKFYDSEFFIKKNRVLDFAQRIVNRGLIIRWSASAHPANLLRFSKKEMELVKKSGLSRLLIGAETANDSELELINKHIGKDTVRQVARICADFEISASFTFVTGYPNSPHKHIDETIDFAEELTKASLLNEAKIHFYGPYPGTPMYALALESGFVPPHDLIEWAEYNYYYVNTPWVPKKYFTRVRAFNETHYPYLTGESMN